ncbi:MAG: hypothetical protein Q7R98_02540 [Candidatus Jorgensenbacteria bacterium]|nr:hypothetical protein [Candidatus Jorgensenbacteria bacterium]
MNKKIISYAVLHAVATSLYVVLVAFFMTNVGPLLGTVADKSMFGPISFLLLFVASATITGLLVFARPIMWYLDGKKKEGLKLAIYTAAALLIITVAVLASLALAIPR